MANKIKYPLTKDAKAWAKKLVDGWNRGVYPQYIVVVERSGEEGFAYGGLNGFLLEDIEKPPLDILLELSNFNLISLEAETFRSDGIPWLPLSGKINYARRWHFVLLQELRNAVKNRFAVSDYFLTFNAVGTIIQGDATITAPFQSGASIFGGVSQTMTPSAIADNLVEILGGDFLQSNKNIAEAIDELRHAVASEKQSKVGNVIMQLGNSLKHVASAYAVLQALGFLMRVLH
jgi:hypothetical protein